MNDSRRGFLRILLAGLAAAPWPLQAVGSTSASPDAATSDGGWDAAAERLCGVKEMDHGLLHDVRAALLTRYDPAGVEKLAQVAAAASDETLAADLKRAGLDDIAGDALSLIFGVERLADFDFSAIPVWAALAYTKPPTHCSPQFGDWAQPPKGVSHG